MSEPKPTFPGNFTKRVFVEAKQSSKREVSFLLQDKFENCGKELNANEINKSLNSCENRINCSCGAELKLTLRIRIQVEVLSQNKFIMENPKFLNPKTTKNVVDELLSEGSNYLHFDIEALRKNTRLYL